MSQLCDGVVSTWSTRGYNGYLLLSIINDVVYVCKGKQRRRTNENIE